MDSNGSSPVALSTPVPVTVPMALSTARPARPAKRKTASSTVPVAKKAKYSKYYTLKNKTAEKFETFGQPPVHADIRQSLCEALPYYRAHQSGAYTKDNIVHGFLCDKEASKRAKFDDQIMIATTGGGRVADENGNMVIGRDNHGNSFSRAFANTKELRLPVGVILGKGNPLFNGMLPSYYNVLAWYQVTDVWCELTTEKTVNKVPMKRWLCRLEKIDLSETSWWAAKDSPNPPVQPDFETKAAVASCCFCRQESKTIYNAGWACMNPECMGFFDFGKQIDHDTLDIDIDFIRERTRYNGALGDLRPAPPVVDIDAVQTPEDTIKFGKAIVCPKCHACISKTQWSSWECLTAGCGFVHTVITPPIGIDEALLNSKKITSSMIAHHSDVKLTQVKFGAYQVDIYELPDLEGKPAGFVAHLKSNDLINQQHGGPDDIFKQMQIDMHGVERGISRGGKGGTTQTLTNHYATNWGAPYKWHVKQQSTSFADSPDSVITMLNRLGFAGSKVTEYGNQIRDVGDFLGFNEVLTVGYKQKNSMGYHDDGEKQLGPTVSSVSLGCSATMMWRPKWKAFGDLRPSSVGKATKPFTNRQGNPARLKIVLKHGDMMVMHGSGIQKLYEHAVDSLGKLRFAVTARHVMISALPIVIQADALAAGTIPAYRQLPAYDGDEFAQPVQCEE